MVWTKQRLNNLFFFLGCAACVVMLFTFDVSFVELWEHITHAGYWLIPIIGIWIVVYGLNAFAWLSIIKGNVGKEEIVNRKLSNSKFFWRIYRLTITGYALNYATPVGGLGGEPYRIMELSKDIDNQHATSSVILYAMMHFFAHFWFWFISIFIYLALVLVGDMPMTTAIGTILGIIILFCLLAFWIFSKGYRNGLVVYVLGLIGKIPFLKGWSRRFRGKHAEALRNIDAQISALYSQDTKAFYTSLMLEYTSRMVQSLEVMFMLLLFGIDNGGGLDGMVLTYLHSVLIVAFTTLFANLIGFLPMQIGVQEGGFVLSIAALGLSAALGIFVSIICRVREIIWIAIGMALMKIKE
ncbi:MAG: flippase-like domain-containing protein [Prevotella sp.]|nr:flippase-like domain-containing protein [Prevotella sp.]